MKLYRDGANTVIARKDVSFTGPKEALSLWVKPLQTNARSETIVIDVANRTLASVRFEDTGNIRIFYGNGTGSSSYEDVRAYSANTWYHIRIDTDDDNHKFRVWINGILERDWSNFYNDRTNPPDKIELNSGTGTGTCYIDRINWGTEVLICSETDGPTNHWEGHLQSMDLDLNCTTMLYHYRFRTFGTSTSLQHMTIAWPHSYCLEAYRAGVYNDIVLISDEDSTILTTAVQVIDTFYMLTINNGGTARDINTGDVRTSIDRGHFDEENCDCGASGHIWSHDHNGNPFDYKIILADGDIVYNSEAYHLFNEEDNIDLLMEVGGAGATFRWHHYPTINRLTTQEGKNIVVYT